VGHLFGFGQDFDFDFVDELGVRGNLVAVAVGAGTPPAKSSSEEGRRRYMWRMMLGFPKRVICPYL
jgi:hypothetical protein